MTYLKPCPFKHEVMDGVKITCVMEGYIPMCLDCSAAPGNFSYATEEEAIVAWNTRTEPPAPVADAENKPSNLRMDDDVKREK